MGFAEEVSQAKTTNTFVATEVKAAAKLDPAVVQDTTPGTHALDSVVTAPEPATVPSVVATPIVPPEPAQAVEKAKIRIGTQEFDSAEAAIQYAQDLELAVLQQEAYRQGAEDLRTKAAAVPERTIEDEIEQELFENPKKALLTYKQHILEAAKAAIKAEAQQETSRRETWQSFYETNNDLADAKEIVDMVWEKNQKELGPMTVAAGLKKLADKSRALLSSYKTTVLPTRDLPGSVAQATSASGAPSTAPAKKAETLVDFISQVNKHRKRSAQQSA